MEQTDSPKQLEAQTLIEGLAEDSCLSLFKAYGVDLEPRALEHIRVSEDSLTGIIGFTGNGITGMCLVTASEAPLIASNPVGGTLRDWVAELSNQLAGRLKHKLLAQGVEVYITTPIVLRATKVEPLPRHQLVPRSFGAKDGSVALWVEVETSPDFVLQPGGGEEAVAEGETLLF